MNGDQDRWTRNASLLKRLYQDARKTPKQVKKIMEEEHGFPIFPESTYEAKLRDLGLRKKFKAGDWARIYQYARAQGFEKFDVLLNGTLIEWNKAWKEMRRSGVTRSGLPMDPRATLPDGVEIRAKAGPSSPRRRPTASATVTGVPMEHQNTIPPRQHRQSAIQLDIVEMNAENIPTSGDWALIPRTGIHRGNNDSQSLEPPGNSSAGVWHSQPWMRNHNVKRGDADTRWRYLFARVNLETLPWIDYRFALLRAFHQIQRNRHSFLEFEPLTLALMPADGFFGQKPDGLSVLISDTYFPAIDDLSAHLSYVTISPKDFSSRRFLAQIVYLFSNNLVHLTHEELLGVFHVLEHGIPQSLLISLFKNGMASTWGLWQSLFNQALEVNRLRNVLKPDCRRGLRLLIRLALTIHPDWIDADKERILYAAVWCGDESIIKQILGRGALPTYIDWRPMEGFTHNAFTIAAEYGAMGCAEALLQHWHLKTHEEAHESGGCLVSETSTINMSEGAIIVSDIYKQLVFKVKSDPQSLSLGYLSVLKLLLEAGINVDRFCRDTLSRYKPTYDGVYISRHQPTYLDVSFYYNTLLFEFLLPYSRNFGLTRAGVCMAAQGGRDSLAIYLAAVASVPSDLSTDQFLELILFEQFQFPSASSSGQRKLLDGTGRTARVLIEAGVRFDVSRFGSAALTTVVIAATEYSFSSNLEFLLETLLDWGACMNSSVLATAVTKTGTDVLARILLSFTADVTVCGSEALLKAARLGNFEAVSLLVSSGVDVNGQVHHHRALSQPGTIIQELLDAIYYDGGCKADNGPREAARFLINSGARLISRSTDSTCFELLRRFLFPSNAPQIVFALEFKDETRRLTPEQWLELMFTWFKTCSTIGEGHAGLTDALLQQCRLFLPRPILAEAIMAECTIQDVKKLIALGADVNEVSEAPTPLQAAAIRRNVELASYLLKMGADVNSPPRGHIRGGTALQLVCGWDSIAPSLAYQRTCLIEEMLAHGADVNAPSTGGRCSTALQLVCAWGLDDAEILPKENLLRVMREQRDVIRILLDHGADANAPAYGKYGATALRLLCAHCYRHHEASDLAHELLIILIEHGADVNTRPGRSSKTAIQHCASEGRLRDMTLLVQHGADPNSYPLPYIESRYRSEVYCLALDMAAGQGRLDTVKYLLNIGAISGKPGTTGFQGAISHALLHGHRAITDIIRTHSQTIADSSSLSVNVLIAQNAAAIEEWEAGREVTWDTDDEFD